MPDDASPPSPRRTELLEACYRYVLEHGLADLSLRPLATAVGSSPRVLLFLFGSKDGLVRALLARARADELTVLGALERGGDPSGEALTLDAACERVWGWLADPDHRPLLRLWVEGYARSLVDPTGPWAGFAAATVDDWMTVLAGAQSARERRTRSGTARRSAALALLRGCLLDLLATGDVERTTRALRTGVAGLGQVSGISARTAGRGSAP